MSTVTSNLFFILFGLFILCLTACNFESDIVKAQPPIVQNAAPAADIQPISVSAEEMMHDWCNNKVAAETKYKNKIIIVRGMINDIQKSFGSIRIKLKTHESSYDVNCSFSQNNKEAITHIHKNQYITIQGKCSGAFGDINMGDCQFIEN